MWGESGEPHYQSTKLQQIFRWLYRGGLQRIGLKAHRKKHRYLRSWGRSVGGLEFLTYIGAFCDQSEVINYWTLNLHCNFCFLTYPGPNELLEPNARNLKITRHFGSLPPKYIDNKQRTQSQKEISDSQGDGVFRCFTGGARFSFFFIRKFGPGSRYTQEKLVFFTTLGFHTAFSPPSFPEHKSNRLGIQARKTHGYARWWDLAVFSWGFWGPGFRPSLGHIISCVFLWRGPFFSTCLNRGFDWQGFWKTGIPDHSWTVLLLLFPSLPHTKSTNQQTPERLIYSWIFLYPPSFPTLKVNFHVRGGKQKTKILPRCPELPREARG